MRATAAADGSVHDHEPSDDSSDDTPDADAVSALHTQALGVLNIRALVPVVLDLNTPSFSKWRRLFLLILGKYALADHVLSDAVFPNVPHWVHMDLHVLTWLYGSITSELFEIVVSSPSPSACAAWVALEQQFIGNCETRIQLINTEFRTLCQGVLSVTEYCRRMKTLADSLVELGEPVPDRALASNVLHGLSERFHNLRLFLQQRLLPSFVPSFVEIRSELLLEELTMASLSSSPPSALVVAPKSAASAPASSAPASGGPSGGAMGGGD
jgi:hypothetical protein